MSLLQITYYKFTWSEKKRPLTPEVIAKLSPNRHNATSDEDIVSHREGGWDEGFAISSPVYAHRSLASH
ncbi:MAG: hypothetical protein IJJ26_01485 [Victivallales bacterium]|nr:hypothetical protein [Victivallales bacterium]